MSAGFRCPIRKRARSSTACRMTSGASSTRRRRLRSRRRRSRRQRRSTDARFLRICRTQGRGDRMPDVGGIAGEQLKSFIERIERLEEEKRALSADIKDVYAEAKGSGFDTAIMRQIIRIRRMDQDDVDEQETLLDVYKRALGMLPDIDPATKEAAE